MSVMNNANANTEETIRALLQAQMGPQAPGINPPGGPGQEGAGPPEPILAPTSPLDPVGEQGLPPVAEADMMAQQPPPEELSPIEAYIRQAKGVQPPPPQASGAMERAAVGAIPVPNAQIPTASPQAEGRFSADMQNADQIIGGMQANNAQHMGTLGVNQQQLDDTLQSQMSRKRSALRDALMGIGLE